MHLLWVPVTLCCALSEFFTTVLTALPIELLALILYFKALKLSPLWLTVPFLALTPLFLIVIPYLLLGERITLRMNSLAFTRI